MSGFNTDVQAGSDHYHVQTQVTRAGVETLVYMGGQVVYARRISNAGAEAATEQHERIVAGLADGTLDLFVGEDEGNASLSDSINGGASAAEGVLTRLGDFVRRHRHAHRQPPAFWVDAETLRRVAHDGNGSVTVRLAHPTGKPVVGATVEVERFQLLGPAIRLTDALTDDDGNLTFDCDLGNVRPVGLTLRSEWDGSETTARFLV